MTIMERNIYRLLLLAALGYIFFQQICGSKGKACPEVVKETIDTSYLYKQWASEWKKPKPDTVYKSGDVVKVPVPVPEYVYQDPVFVEVPAKVDTAAIIQDYYATAVYRDSTELIVDSSEKSYGTVYVEDFVSQNRIQARQWSFNLAIPTITKTITLAEKPRSQLYVGFSGLFGRSLIKGGEMSLSLKNKRDQQFELAAGLQDFGPKPDWYGRLGTKFKLSFR